MSFHNAKERRKFEREWAKLREQYRAAGFSEEGIDAMRTFDEEIFQSRRRYENHTQELLSENVVKVSLKTRHGAAKPAQKLENLTVSFDESSFAGRYAWADTISDPALTYRIRQLKPDDLELLTLYAIGGYSQPEIARMMGCSQQNISLKLSRIKNFLKNI
jgi:DNA-directed RNA polymerase specialized sigma24 family protein